MARNFLPFSKTDESPQISGGLDLLLRDRYNVVSADVLLIMIKDNDWELICLDIPEKEILRQDHAGLKLPNLRGNKCLSFPKWSNSTKTCLASFVFALELKL